MEFDWSNWPVEGVPAQRALEEAFEDPFSLRFLPDSPYGEREARYFLLGRSISNVPFFAVFWTDGKRYRVIAAREMSEDEQAFYDRRNAETL